MTKALATSADSTRRGSQILQTWAALFRAEFHAVSMYRTQVLLSVFSWVVPLAFMVLWRANVRQSGNQTVSPSQVTTYYAVLLITTNISLSGPILNRLSSQIHSGQLSPKLLLPLHPLKPIVAFGVALKSMRFIPLIAIVPLVVWAGHGHIKFSLVRVLDAVALVFLGMTCTALIAGLVGCWAFWLGRSSSAVQGIVSGFEWVLGGLVAPLALYPAWLFGVLQYQPFYFAHAAPAQVISGISDPRASQLLLALAWVVALSALFRWTWAAGLRRYEAVGT